MVSESVPQTNYNKLLILYSLDLLLFLSRFGNMENFHQDVDNTLLTEALKKNPSTKDTVWSPFFIILYQTHFRKCSQHVV